MHGISDELAALVGRGVIEGFELSDRGLIVLTLTAMQWESLRQIDSGEPLNGAAGRTRGRSDWGP